METFRNAGMKEAERFLLLHKLGTPTQKKRVSFHEIIKRFDLILLGISSNTFYAKRKRHDLAIEFPKIYMNRSEESNT